MSMSGWSRAALITPVLLLAACTASTSSGAVGGTSAPASSVSPFASAGRLGPSGPSAPSRPTRAQLAADAALIAGMYARINVAFRQDPNRGVREIVAAEYPDTTDDVDFTRCVHAIAPRAKVLPAGMILEFTPKMQTMAPDPGYQVTTLKGKQIRPRGRVYSTVVVIAGNGIRPGEHDRHQVVLDGKVYQFSSC
jgi:hypothetical protein